MTETFFNVGNYVAFIGIRPGCLVRELLHGTIKRLYSTDGGPWAFVDTPWGIFEKRLAHLTHADAITRLGRIVRDV